jgi:hypothetical protein
MTQSEKTLQEKKLSDRLWSLLSGFIMLLISFGLTYAAFFEKRTEQTADIPILNLILLLTVTWSLTICSFCYFFRHPFLVRIYHFSGFLSAASLMIFLMLISLTEMLKRYESSKSSFDGVETFFVLIASLNIIGIIIFFSSKFTQRKQEKNISSDSIAASPLIIFIWPVIILARNLFGLFWLFCVVALTIFGNWIGAKLSHPFLGTVFGLALLPVCGSILLAYVARTERIKRASQQNIENPSEPSHKSQT